MPKLIERRDEAVEQVRRQAFRLAGHLRAERRSGHRQARPTVEERVPVRAEFFAIEFR